MTTYRWIWESTLARKLQETERPCERRSAAASLTDTPEPARRLRRVLCEQIQNNEQHEQGVPEAVDCGP